MNDINKLLNDISRENNVNSKILYFVIAHYLKNTKELRNHDFECINAPLSILKICRSMQIYYQTGFTRTLSQHIFPIMYTPNKYRQYLALLLKQLRKELIWKLERSRAKKHLRYIAKIISMDRLQQNIMMTPRTRMNSTLSTKSYLDIQALKQFQNLIWSLIHTIKTNPITYSMNSLNPLHGATLHDPILEL